MARKPWIVKDYVTGGWYFWPGRYGYSLNPLIWLKFIVFFFSITRRFWYMLAIIGLSFIIGKLS